MRRAALAALIAGLLASPGARADEAAATGFVREVAGRLFTELGKGDAARATDAVAAALPLTDAARKRFRKRLEALIDTAGASEEWSLVRVDGVPGGERYYVAWLISYHARRPVAWSVGVYRTAGGAFTVLDLAFESKDPLRFLSPPQGTSP